jgi:RNA polymerase sigma-70 factor (ECF subfamily)
VVPFSYSSLTDIDYDPNDFEKTNRRNSLKDRNNQDWLTDLTGPEADDAIADLRAILVRGLRAALASRIHRNLDHVLEDFVQDALMKILKNIHTFRGESKFTTWAQKIAIHVAFTELRRRRWRDISLQEMVEDDDGNEFTPAILQDPGASPEQLATRKSLLEFVQTMIDEELTERQRTAITAVMFKGVPIDEVADRMDTNRNALYKLIYDARQRLQQSMIANGISPQEVLAAFEK